MLLYAKRIKADYGAAPVLKGISLEVHAGEMIGIIGENGSGKSTLLRILAGLQETQEGEVSFDTKVAREQAVAYLDQAMDCHWPLAVEQVVALGRMPHLRFGQALGDADWEAVGAAMQEADVHYLKGRDVQTLSGGEQARVYLARALAVQAPLLLADEPISGLDAAHQLAVMERLRSRAAGNRAVICVLHDLTLAARFCDRLLLLHEGKVLADGVPEDVLTSGNLAKALKVEVLAGNYGRDLYVIPWRGL
jgi:iron complex transport system ATP-binding protein